MRKITTCILLSLASSAAAATIGDRRASLALQVEGSAIHALLESEGMAGFASGPYLWQATIGGEAVTGLHDPQVSRLNPRTLVVRGRLGPLEVEQHFTLLENAAGIREVINVRNPGPQAVALDDIRTGFTRQLDPATDPYRLVAVPYRRQADGSTHDYGMADVARVTQQGGKLNATGNRPPVLPLVDEERRRLRSESWILTDGKHSLLVLKYNNQAVEHGAVSWLAGENRLVFGGCAYVLHKEPVQANSIAPGATFRFGETRYQFYPGGWPEGYAHYKAFINRQGHGLKPEYQPQVQWNVLFDLGSRAWTRQEVEAQAALARELGLTRMYFDPGWQQPISDENPRPAWGSDLWDTKRLGTVEEMVGLMRDTYGLELGLWSAARINQDWHWPKEYFRQVPAASLTAPTVRQRHHNLSLLPLATAKASSSLSPAHPPAKLKDGLYGHDASWIAGEMPAWVELDLHRQYRVSQVTLSNDRTGTRQDRGTTSFRIFTATQHSSDPRADTWQLVAEYAQFESQLTTQMNFTFAPVDARWVRIEFLDPPGENIRIDEIEVYQALPGEDRSVAVAPAADTKDDALQTLNELCMSHEGWQAERLRRLMKLTDGGVKFLMFDFHGWNGPCHAPDHGHAVPSTTLDHINSIYGLSRKLRERHPDLRVEMHDAIWTWGSRYLPSYFRQGLTDGDYDENWGYEFMWNSIGDLRSGKALSLYYYNLANDIPLYLHFNMHADNDQSLVFWWMASTIRHLGFGGRTHEAKMEPHGTLPELSPAQKQTRFENYKVAMASYNRLKEYFTHGQFVGIEGDETLHLHTLPGQGGGVLLVFNLTDKSVTRSIRVPLRSLNLPPSSPLPAIAGARGRLVGENLVLELSLAPESPALVEIGAAVSPASTAASVSVADL